MTVARGSRSKSPICHSNPPVPGSGFAEKEIIPMPAEGWRPRWLQRPGLPLPGAMEIFVTEVDGLESSDCWEI